MRSQRGGNGVPLAGGRRRKRRQCRMGAVGCSLVARGALARGSCYLLAIVLRFQVGNNCMLIHHGR